MSVDCVYEILNHCEDVESVYAWLEAIDNAHIPGLGWIPSLDYIPSCVLQKFAGKLVPYVPMRDENIPLYMKYIGMINWNGVHKRYGDNMDPEFAQVCREFMPDDMQVIVGGRHVPARPASDENIPYYEKYFDMIDWQGVYKANGRSTDPEFDQLYKKYVPKFYSCAVRRTLIPFRPMCDSNISYYQKYADKIDWREAYRRHGRSISPKFVRECQKYLPKRLSMRPLGKFVPFYTMTVPNIAYYKEHAHMIDWIGALNKHRHVHPEFAVILAEYIDWNKCQNMYISYELLQVIKGRICLTNILDNHRLSDSSLIEFVKRIDWDSPSGQARIGTAGTELQRLIAHKFPSAWETYVAYYQK